MIWTSDKKRIINKYNRLALLVSVEPGKMICIRRVEMRGILTPMSIQQYVKEQWKPFTGSNEEWEKLKFKLL